MTNESKIFLRKALWSREKFIRQFKYLSEGVERGGVVEIVEPSTVKYLKGN